MILEKIQYLLDLIALLIQITASVIVYLNSPVNKPMGLFMSNNVDMKTPELRNRKLRFGFLLLCVGFCIQLLSSITKNPF